jgi:uncharacterized protein YgbK (DUF1537 family)
MTKMNSIPFKKIGSDSDEVGDKSGPGTTDGKILVVADDFTGACDTGIQFSKRNLKSIVITDKERINKSLEECDVLVVDTESRCDNREKAYDKAFEIGDMVKTKNIKYIYKKFDSTFRGNIGAELSGLMDAMEIQHAVIVPAFPLYRRITKNGLVYINDKLLAETEFSVDPRTPVKESSAPKIISRQTDKSIGLLNYKDIKAGKQNIIQKLQELINDRVQMIIIDALNDKDMDLIASVAVSLEDRIMFAGSTGFAQYLSKYLEPVNKRKINIVIAGSVSEITREQIFYAEKLLPLSMIDIDIEKLFRGENRQEKKRIMKIVSRAAQEGIDVIIRSSPSGRSVSESFELGQKYGLSRCDISEIIAVFLGEIAGDIIRHININGILLTGGDTAIKTVEFLKVSGITLQNEVQAGIPCGHFIEEQFRNITIISKAGGFGSEDAVFQVLKFLTSRSRS